MIGMFKKFFTRISKANAVKARRRKHGNMRLFRSMK